MHDQSRCACLGLCEAVAPELFEIGADGALQVLNPQPAQALRAVLEEAVESCPTGALSVED